MAEEMSVDELAEYYGKSDTTIRKALNHAEPLHAEEFDTVEEKRRAMSKRTAITRWESLVGEVLSRVDNTPDADRSCLAVFPWQTWLRLLLTRRQRWAERVGLLLEERDGR